MSTLQDMRDWHELRWGRGFFAFGAIGMMCWAAFMLYFGVTNWNNQEHTTERDRFGETVFAGPASEAARTNVLFGVGGIALGLLFLVLAVRAHNKLRKIKGAHLNNFLTAYFKETGIKD